MRLTQSIVDALALPPGKQEVRVFDEARNAPSGFGVRMRGDRRSYILQYRDQGASKTRRLAGTSDVTLDEARDIARAYHAQILLKGDPRAAKAAAVQAAKVAKMEAARDLITLGAMYEAFLDHLAKHGRSDKHIADTRRYLKTSWQPLHALRVEAITRRDVAGQLTKITAASGDISGNRARVALSSFFKWALGEGLAEMNPVSGTNRPAAEVSRDRVLSDDELVSVWKACADDDYGRIVRLLILTAGRRDEVGAMAWAEIDLSRRLWTVPAERTKNGRPHEVPLTDAMVAVLESTAERADIPCVFGQSENGYGGWSKSKAALDERIAEARAEAGKDPMPAWRVHDIRRTAATRMADDLAIGPHIVEAVLNHVSGHRAGVAGVYNRAAYRKEKTEALARWSRRITSLTADPSSKVVTFPTGSAA